MLRQCGASTAALWRAARRRRGPSRSPAAPQRRARRRRCSPGVAADSCPPRLPLRQRLQLRAQRVGTHADAECAQGGRSEPTSWQHRRGGQLGEGDSMRGRETRQRRCAHGDVLGLRLHRLCDRLRSCHRRRHRPPHASRRWRWRRRGRGRGQRRLCAIAAHSGLRGLHTGASLWPGRGSARHCAGLRRDSCAALCRRGSGGRSSPEASASRGCRLSFGTVEGRRRCRFVNWRRWTGAPEAVAATAGGRVHAAPRAVGSAALQP